MTARDRDLEIVRRYRAGETTTQLGERFGLSAERVRQILLALGEVRRRPGTVPAGKFKATAAQQAEILRRRHRGEPVSAIARALGLGWHNVASVLQAAGHETRSPRRRSQA